MDMPHDLLVYAHIGDLHLTEEDTETFRDFQAIVSEIASELADGIDFVYVPGDNADNGLPGQYALAKQELARLPMPVHIITGDHDMEPGSLDHFYAALEAPKLPKAVEAGGIRCLLLDICGTGTGGPDFRIGEEQIGWLVDQLAAARSARKNCAVFMHTYPDDLKGDGETAAVNAALAADNVLLVDMGHTHYNELANDGRTIFAVTRSTGQIEEGPVGYSIAAIDGRTVSWRFKELGQDFPIVLITAPADRRLATNGDDRDHVPTGTCEVRASILGRRRVTRCVCRVDEDPDIPMPAKSRGRHAATVSLPPGAQNIVVEAEDDAGHIGRETIEIATREHLARDRNADGSDKDAIDAWEGRGILGTQLGPNRNGRKW